MDALDYARQLVAFDSTSRLSNAEVSQHLETTLQMLGFETERVEYRDEQDILKVNVLGRKGPAAKSDTGGMAYFCHTDVVPADEWFTQEHGSFEPTVIVDRLYGRGSCDMKGSLACMLSAAEVTQDAELNRPLYIVATADEEVGYVGARHVVENSQFYREIVTCQSRAIIGEPTELDVVYAHKGSYGFRVTARGTAAHSSSNEGENANLKMIPFLSEMKAIHDATLSDPAWLNDEFDPPGISWNIGVNDHTRAVNITPPQSVCTVYFRPMPEQNGEELLSKVRKLAEEMDLAFEIMFQAEPFYTKPDSEFIREVRKLTDSDQLRTVSYGTDGAVFSELDNLVVIGPGNIAQAHTHDEWIALEQLIKGAELFERMIRWWCCDAE